MGEHLIDGQFQSDKYPTTPRGKVPLSCGDPSAQDLLWIYAERHRRRDPGFSADLQQALTLQGYDHEGERQREWYERNYTGHGRGVVVEQTDGKFTERAMTPAELAARAPAMLIAADIHRIACYAAFAYIKAWEIIAPAIERAMALPISWIVTSSPTDKELLAQSARDGNCEWSFKNGTVTVEVALNAISRARSASVTGHEQPLQIHFSNVEKTVLREIAEREDISYAAILRKALQQYSTPTAHGDGELRARDPDAGSGWVIEHRNSPGYAPNYWAGNEWSTDNLRAIRFSRKVDAERAAAGFDEDDLLPNEDEHRIAEHGWG